MDSAVTPSPSADDEIGGSLFAGQRRLASMVNSKVIWNTGLILLAAAFAIRLAFVLTVPAGLHYPDEQDFGQIAHGIADGHGYVSRSFRANPVLPYYLAACYRLFGDHLLPGRIGQALLSALTCVLLYRIGARTVNFRTGVIAGAILAVYPQHIYLAGYFYVDAILIFLITLSVCLGIVTAQRDERGGGIALTLLLAWVTGVCLGLTALTRPIFLLGIPSIALAWLCVRPPLWPRRIVLAIMLVIGSAMTIAPWTYRNYQVYHRFILISTGLGTKLWQGNNELADGSAYDRELYWNHWDKGGWHQRLARLNRVERTNIQDKYGGYVNPLVQERWQALEDQGHEDDRELAADPVLEPLAVEWIKQHPLRATELFFRKLVTLFDAYSPTISEQGNSGSKKLIAQVSFYPILALALVGLVIGLTRWRELASIYLLIFLVCGAYCVLNTCTRFRLPLDGFLILLAAMTMVSVWDRWRARGLGDNIVPIFDPTR